MKEFKVEELSFVLKVLLQTQGTFLKRNRKEMKDREYRSWQEERHSFPVRQGEPGSEQREIQEDGADI